MFSLAFVLDRARQFVRHGLHLLGSLLDDFLNVSPLSPSAENNSYFSDDSYGAARRGCGSLSSLPWKTAGLATAGQFLLTLLGRLPLTGMFLLAGGVVAGLVLVALDPDTLQNLRDKLSP